MAQKTALKGRCLKTGLDKAIEPRQWVHYPTEDRSEPPIK